MSEFIPLERIESKILLIRGQKVLLDRELAELYGVPTKVFNQAVRRNAKRFPKDFMFQLDHQEFTDLRSQIVTSSLGHGGRRYMPYVFSEHGAIMAATILNSPKAIDVSVLIVRAFVRMREIFSSNAQFAKKLAELEERLDKHDENTLVIMATLRKLISKPEGSKKQKIGFSQ